MKSFWRAPAAKSQLLSAKVAREVRSHGSGQSCTRSAFPQQPPLRLQGRKCFRAKAACEARSRISSSKIATCRQPACAAKTARRYGQQRLTRDRDMKGWVREVAQHHAREKTVTHSIMRSIMHVAVRNATRSTVCNIMPAPHHAQHHA